jgi:hypothetical protein
MSVRFTAKAGRGVIALTVAAGLAVGAAGCGGSDDDGKRPETSESASRETGSRPTTQEGQSEAPMAELKGPTGLLLQINTVTRDAGGFVTVSGNLKNDGGKSAVIPAQLSGNETEVLRHGRSLGGATLVDSKGRKRYYVLRDTDGRPLTTTGIATVKSGESLPVFMQFPAPPTGTAEVTFELPLFASAPVQITG